MEIMLWLLPTTGLLTGIAVMAVFWATRRGQFDDLDRHGFDILDDDNSETRER
ncbi:MAG: cbb3-type cytochrome oxidase assembly protein CcoS [Pseudomonadales bacterium]